MLAAGLRPGYPGRMPAKFSAKGAARLEARSAATAAQLHLRWSLGDRARLLALCEAYGLTARAVLSLLVRDASARGLPSLELLRGEG